MKCGSGKQVRFAVVIQCCRQGLPDEHQPLKSHQHPQRDGEAAPLWAHVPSRGCTPAGTCAQHPLCRLSSSRHEPGLSQAYRCWFGWERRAPQMWVGSCSEEPGGCEMGDGRTPGSPAGCSGGSAGCWGDSACTCSVTEAVVLHSCVRLRATESPKQPALAGGHPGPGEKKLFWSPAHAPLLMEQRWAVASPSQRGGEHRGALTLISFTNIKGLSKAETMPCYHHHQHDDLICSSAMGAEPQCTITTQCQHHQLHCSGPTAWHSHLPRHPPAKPTRNSNSMSTPAASGTADFIRHA